MPARGRTLVVISGGDRGQNKDQVAETLPCGQVLADGPHHETASATGRAQAWTLPDLPAFIGGKFLQLVQMGLAT